MLERDESWEQNEYSFTRHNGTMQLASVYPHPGRCPAPALAEWQQARQDRGTEVPSEAQLCIALKTPLRANILCKHYQKFLDIKMYPPLRSGPLTYDSFSKNTANSHVGNGVAYPASVGHVAS